MTEKILRRQVVLERVGFSRSKLYDDMSKQLFPRPVRLGVRAVGWRESDIVAWLASRKTTDQMG
jgi:prophage regulatory protein